MSEREDDSDAPEELSSEQGFLKDEELRKVQDENKARVAREVKERRRRWAQRKKTRESVNTEKSNMGVKDESGLIEEEEVTHPGLVGSSGMLPSNIVEVLAAREKQVFTSDSEEEVEEKPVPERKRAKHSGPEHVVLKDLPPAPCLQGSLEFLKKRKMQVQRSSSALKNSNQALRRISASGLLGKK